MDQIVFTITCPYCKRNLKCPARLVGRENPCPGCQKPFLIPFPVAVPIEQQQGDGSEVCGGVTWDFSESEDDMDDSVVRSASVSADEEKCGLRPQLICRATVKKCSVLPEVFVSFPKKVFSIRDDLLPARIRVDRDESLEMPISASETGNACFFQEEKALLSRMYEANALLVELPLMRDGRQVFEFNVLGFGELHGRMLAGAVGAGMNQLLGFNQDLVDHVFRLGPKNTEALIGVLCKSKLLHNDQFDEARRKGLALFAAVQAFGEKRHVAEIYGHIEGSKINDPFQIAVYNNLSPATRREIGETVISE